MDISKRGLKVLAGNLYQDATTATWLREALQNSIDSKPSKIAISHYLEKGYYITTCSDDGRGMTKEFLETELQTIGESEKDDLKGGGFGMAKALLFLYPDRTVIQSNGWEIDGWKEDFLLGSLKAHRCEYAEGTTITCYKYGEYFDPDGFLNTCVRSDIVLHSPKPLPINESVSTPFGIINLHGVIGEARSCNVPVYLNGIRQFGYVRYAYEEDKLVRFPEYISIDLEVDVLDEDYPFSLNRDGFKYSAEKYVAEVFQQVHRPRYTRYTWGIRFNDTDLDYSHEELDQEYLRVLGFYLRFFDDDNFRGLVISDEANGVANFEGFYIHPFIASDEELLGLICHEKAHMFAGGHGDTWASAFTDLVVAKFPALYKRD